MQLEELAKIDYQLEENVARIAESVRSSNPKIKTPIRVPSAIIANVNNRFYKCSIIIEVDKKHYYYRLFTIEEVSTDEYLDTYLNMTK